MLKATPQQPSILTHTWATVLATVVGFTAAMVLGTVIAAALWWWNALYQACSIRISSCQRDAEDGLRADLLSSGSARRLSIYGMSLAISLFVTILMIYSGFQGIDPNKIKLAQTFGATKAQVLTKVVLPGSVPTLIAALKVNAGLSLVGVVVGEFQSANLGLGYLILYGSQIFKTQHRDDRDHDSRDRLLADVSRHLLARSRGDAAAVKRLSIQSKKDARLCGRASHLESRCLITRTCAAPPARAAAGPRRWSSRRRRRSGNCSATPHAPRRVSEALPSDSMTTR